jgi:4'-phosphopantetheinyl transferase
MTSDIAQWNLSPTDYMIPNHSVHIWRAYFQPNLLLSKKFLEIISEEETNRGQRFIRQIDRERFVFSHGLIRLLLGAYLDCPPKQLIFETKPHHKPFLVSPDCGHDIRFSLSHSENMVLIAVARGIEVGIDVEYMRRIPDAVQIVNGTFSVDERKLLNSLPPEDFNEGFYTYWTSKEAFLKGIGKGLSYPLDKFTISFLSNESEGSICVHDDPDNPCSWKIMRLSPGPDYSGALAIKEPWVKPQFFEYRWQ